MKYYALIGFERYTHKVEISESVYNKALNDADHISSWKQFSIETLAGRIGLRFEKINFIQYIKEYS